MVITRLRGRKHKKTASESPVSGIVSGAGRSGTVRNRTGGLTVLILAVNIVAPLILVIAVLYLGQYRDSLIKAEIATLETQAQLFAGVISEGALQSVEQRTGGFVPLSTKRYVLLPDIARRLIRRLSENTKSRARLFDASGDLLADSHQIIAGDGVIQIVNLEPRYEQNSVIDKALRLMTRGMMKVMPDNPDLAVYSRSEAFKINAFPDAISALDGRVSATPWLSERDTVVLTAAAPIIHGSDVVGVLYLSHESFEIEDAMTKIRHDVLTVFLGTLSLTVFLSIYLAGLIGRPLKKLARAAEKIRNEQGHAGDIPDLSHRRDEIGELSMALRNMTEALAKRIDSIEAFAADVAHELKNPLTSLRSAVETAVKVDNEDDRRRMMDIILHDVRRLDRLITDISRASRLDAELSRDDFEEIDIIALVKRIVASMQTQLRREDNAHANSIHLDIDIDPLFTVNGDQNAKDARDTHSAFIKGNEPRLVQVFENLIVNAVSFSPKDGHVTIAVHPSAQHDNMIEVTISDQGPGIPETKLDAIFERFYSERPKHETYGNHSGLGLAISKQIIEAHKATITAQNITADLPDNNAPPITETDAKAAKDRPNGIYGARFSILFPRT